jgi:hypothetical protein
MATTTTFPDCAPCCTPPVCCPDMLSVTAYVTYLMSFPAVVPVQWTAFGGTQAHWDVWYPQAEAALEAGSHALAYLDLGPGGGGRWSGVITGAGGTPIGSHVEEITQVLTCNSTTGVWTLLLTLDIVAGQPGAPSSSGQQLSDTAPGSEVTCDPFEISFDIFWGAAEVTE